MDSVFFREKRQFCIVSDRFCQRICVYLQLQAKITLNWYLDAPYDQF